MSPRSQLAALALVVLLVTAGCTTDTQPTPSPAQEISPTETPTEAPETPGTGSTERATTSERDQTTATETTAPAPTVTETPTQTTTEARTESPMESATPTETPTDSDTTTPEPTETENTATEQNSVTIEGSLPVDADTVFRRVETLMGESVEEPRVVVERGPFSVPNRVADRTVPQVFGLTGWEAKNTTHGITRAGGRLVQLFPGNASEMSIEPVLAHEYAHVIQFQSALPLIELQRDAETTDERIVAGALIEGGAVYVADEYIATHMPEEPSQLSVLAEQYRRATPGYRFFRSRYYFGAQYLHDRLDSPRNLSDAYYNPPESTEALIHNGSVDPEPALTVNLNTSDSWNRALFQNRNWNDTMGELLVRNVLRSELNRSRAAAGAEGWGTDRLFAVSNGSRKAIAWALRWDSPDDAAEFADAFDAYRERQGPATPYAYRLERLGSETTVVLAGPPDVLGATTVSGSNATATVTIAG